MHLGKGAIKPETVKALDENNSVFAIIPPVTALLESQTLERECVAFPELGMEALYRIKVENLLPERRSRGSGPRLVRAQRNSGRML